MAECNAPMFLQKSKGGSTASEVVSDRPLNYGRRVYFRYYKPSIAVADPKTFERAQMIVPEQLLVEVSSLLARDSERGLKSSITLGNGYKIGADRWAFQLTTRADETWYVCPIASNVRNLIAISSAEDFEPGSWLSNPNLSGKARDWMIDKLKAIGQHDIDAVLCVLDHQSCGTILAVFCNGFDLVASALQTWGNPPDSVIRDWLDQRITFPQARQHCSTAETLVTKNGILIPLINLIELLETDACKPILPTPFVNSAPTWPGETVLSLDTTPIESQPLKIAAPRSVFDSALTTPIGTRPISTTKKKSSNRNRLAIAAIAVGGLAATVWLFSQRGEQLTSTPKVPTQADRASNAIASKGGPRDAHSGNSSPLPEDSEIVLTLDAMPNFLDSASTTSELSLESLIAGLSPNTTNPIRLDSLSASSIIAEVLSPAGTVAPNMDPFPAIEDSNESPETSDDVDIQADAWEGGVSKLERSLKLRAAVSKETIAIGKFVLAKACRCDVKFKVAGELIVEPMESVTIEGSDKALWKIAIEDEEPELIVQIASKPGARWQVVASVGLRESRNAAPILIAPRQAQNVGNRLVDYRQWIKGTIETLRTARSNRGRSNFDFTGEIKNLERQDSEAEKAIDRWKVIERLSHYFFDSNEVQIQLNAVAKP